MDLHGVDISRYQGVEAMDGFSFAIVNVEDPGLVDKVERAKALGIPWGLYTWVYPGQGRNDMHRAAQQTERVGDPPLGFWLDYEEAGVAPGDLSAALDGAAELGVLERTGVYTYLYMIDQVADHLRGRPLWLAYYPGSNDGTFPAGSDGDARAHGAVLWQYTSGANAPVGLDRNVVIDSAWYDQWVTNQPAPAPPRPKTMKGSSMYLIVVVTLNSKSEFVNSGEAYLMSPSDRVLADLSSEIDPKMFGLPAAIEPYVNPAKQVLPIAYLSVEQANAITKK